MLANGVIVLAKETRTTPAVTLHASVRAGTICDPPAAGRPGAFRCRASSIAARATRSADEIAEELDSRGVSLTVTVNRHVISLVCTCLAEDFDAVLALLADIVMHPPFPEAEVETRRGEIVTLIRQDEDNPASVAPERLMALLYGETASVRPPPRGTVESVERIGRPALQAFTAGVRAGTRCRWSSSATSSRGVRSTRPPRRSATGAGRRA